MQPRRAEQRLQQTHLLLRRREAFRSVRTRVEARHGRRRGRRGRLGRRELRGGERQRRLLLHYGGHRWPLLLYGGRRWRGQPRIGQDGRANVVRRATAGDMLRAVLARAGDRRRRGWCAHHHRQRARGRAARERGGTREHVGRELRDLVLGKPLHV